MDGGGGEGEVGELTLQQVSSHFLRCLAFVHLSMFLHFDSLPVSIRPLQSFGCGEGGSGGEGGGGEGGGGEGEGDGGSRQVFRHFWYFFLHSLLHCCFPTAPTPAKKSTEMRSSISFIVSAHEGDGASDAGRFERKRAAIAHRRTSQPKGHSQSAVAGSVHRQWGDNDRRKASPGFLLPIRLFFDSLGASEGILEAFVLHVSCCRTYTSSSYHLKQSRRRQFRLQALHRHHTATPAL